MIKTVLGNHSVISHADDRPRRLVERPACCNQGDGRCKVLRKSSTHFGTTTSPLQMDGYTRKPIDCLFDYHVAQGKSLFQAERRLETVTRRVSEEQSTVARSLAHASGYQKPMPDEKNAFSCRPDQGRDTCRNSASASIVSRRLRYQRRFYLRPKFRQLHRLFGPAYPKSPTPKRVSEGQSTLARSLAHASGYQKPMPATAV